MIKGKGTLRQQMMRCYLHGYITNRHNDYNIVSHGDKYKTYKDLKVFGAKEKLIEYGMPRSLASIIVKIAPHFETILSLSTCVILFLNYTLKYMYIKKTSFHNRKFFPKPNALEKRVKDIYNSIGLSTGDLTVIDIPGQYTNYQEFPTVSVFSGISYSQLWKSFINSMLLTCFMIRKYKKDDMLFRTYSSFPFFLCFFFIENLDDSNELVFFNHYDRWMYLFGNSHLHKTYVQHGKLWKDNISRIKCDVAYYISPSQQNVLEYTLFDNKPEARFRKVFDFSGEEKLKNNGRKDLLVICMCLFHDLHEKLVERIYGKKINIYLKPHPGDNMDLYIQFQSKYPEIVILGKFDYPQVDYAISYNSTLADEYEMHDIPVLKYDDINYEEKLKEWFAE